jgi:hypothetical protein
MSAESKRQQVDRKLGVEHRRNQIVADAAYG